MLLYGSVLDLTGNSLNGSIPSSIGNLTMLNTLHLSSNLLNGSIPSTVGAMNALVDVDLSNNGLNGSLPSTIGRLTLLTSLLLNSNGLTGTIPLSIGAANQLLYVPSSFPLVTCVGNALGVNFLLSQVIGETFGHRNVFLVIE